MAFSDNLQFLRIQNEMIQEQLAEQFDVSRQSVSKWENGTSFPEMDTLLRLCDLYNITLDTLLRGNAQASLVADTAQYDRFMTRFAKKIALAIGGIIASVAVMLLLFAVGIHELLAVAFLLLGITVCVVILVASSIQSDHFRKKHPFVTDFYTEKEKESFHHTFVWLMAGGVGTILFGVVLLVAAFAFLPEREPYESIVVALFLLLIAGAVTAFVYGGLMDEKYKIWKYNWDNNPTPEAKQRLDLIGTLCGCIMLLATAIYVGLGFTGNAWDTAWWVFPVGGILCGIVNVILDPYKGEDD